MEMVVVGEARLVCLQLTTSLEEPPAVLSYCVLTLVWASPFSLIEEISHFLLVSSLSLPTSRRLGFQESRKMVDYLPRSPNLMTAPEEVEQLPTIFLSGISLLVVRKEAYRQQLVPADPEYRFHEYKPGEHPTTS